VLARESVIAAVTTDAPAAGHDGVTGNAIARAALSQVTGLSTAERALLDESLGRLTS
jgi:hypothetical protein